jgi:hypothetical protein
VHGGYDVGLWDVLWFGDGRFLGWMVRALMVGLCCFAVLRLAG